MLERVKTLWWALFCVAIAVIVNLQYPLLRARSESPRVVSPNIRPVRRSPPPIPTEPISFAGSMFEGSRAAKVGLIEYADFQCGFCGKFAREILPIIRDRYVRSGQVLLIFREFPLPMHGFARKAAEAAVCAGAQGKFAEMHDSLFANQQELDEPSLLRRADSLRLDRRRFAACLRDEATSQVDQDERAGKGLGISSTPTFFIGTIEGDDRMRLSGRIIGAQPLTQFQANLDQALAKAGALRSR